MTEEEQLESLKRWWKEYGTATILAVVVGVLGYMAFAQLYLFYVNVNEYALN